MAAQHGAGGFVVGLPLSLDGSGGPRAQATRAFARNLGRLTPLAILLWDERLSTAEAERVLLQADASRRRRAAVIDKVAGHTDPARRAGPDDLFPLAVKQLGDAMSLDAILHGPRGAYHAIATLEWFLHPLLLMLATTGVLFILARRATTFTHPAVDLRLPLCPASLVRPSRAGRSHALNESLHCDGLRPGYPLRDGRRSISTRCVICSDHGQSP